MSPFVDLTGLRFGRLLVVRRVANGGRKLRWECLCDCGHLKETQGSNLQSGHTQSCGCLHRERTSEARRTHGEGGTTPEYNAWTAAIGRCENENNEKYPQYGGRGISMCAEWRHDYPAFLAHIGRRPSQLHSLDRIKVDGNYEPGNVRWALPDVQSRNKQGSRIVHYAGRQMPLVQACQISGLNYGTVITRLRKGASDEAAFQPVNQSQSLG